MEYYQQRVIDEELNDLTERLAKLVTFLGSAQAVSLGEEALGLLLMQAEKMLEFQRVLILRVRTFERCEAA